jgi:lipopolysaccharide export system permease protein
VFVSQGKGETFSLVVAAGGYIEQSRDGRFLVLEKGRRYDGVQGTPELRLTEFERYGLRLDPRPAQLSNDSARVKDTMELLRDPSDRNLGELLWRIGLPVSALLLALLAIPMSYVNPRMGRSANLVIALLIYIVYSNVQSLMQAWVAQGRVSFWVGVWVVHAVLAVIIALRFLQRMSLLRWPLRRSRAGRAAAQVPA